MKYFLNRDNIMLWALKVTEEANTIKKELEKSPDSRGILQVLVQGLEDRALEIAKLCDAKRFKE